MEKITKNFTKLTQKKGISLIVLIVTIIVIIILAAALILTVGKNNPVESAREARFKEDIRTFQYELSLAISKNMIAGDQKDEKITELDFEKIKMYISCFSEKYRDKIVIQDNELRYTDKIDEKEKEWLKELNVKEKISLLPIGYTELEYIESTGKQYITLSEFPTIYTKLEMNIVFDNNSSTPTTYFGIWDNNGATIGFQNTYVANLFRGYYNYKWSLTDFGDTDFLIGVHKIKIWNGGVAVDENTIFNKQLSSMSFSDSAKKYGFPVIGFAYMSWVKPDGRSFTNLKLMNLMWYENNVMKYNFIPALDITGKPCLYDTVSKKAFYNQGTGEFLYKEKE